MDRAELERLADRSAWLRALARRLAGPAAADDLAQDTWVSALEAPPPSDRPLRPWLVRVVRNAARMRFRAARRRAKREEAAATTGGDAATPETAVQLLETHRALCDLILALDEPLRRTIVGHYFEGLSLADIGRRDGVVAETVRWRHARALTLIREGLDQRTGGDRHAWLAAFAPTVTWPSRASLAMAGGSIMNKVAIAAVVATVAAAGALWTSHASHEPRIAATPTADRRAAPAGHPAAAIRTVLDASAPRGPGHVIRMANAVERRRELLAQIAAARARRTTGVAPSTTSGAPSASPAVDPAAQVAQMLTGVLQEVRDDVAACADRANATLPAFKTELVLTGDPDVGTLIDASAIVGLQGQPVPAQLDDCVRDVMQRLELPPMAVGDAFKVALVFDDEPR